MGILYLSQSFCFAHFQRVDLGPSHGGEGCFRAECLSHSHGHSSLTRSRLACDKDGASSDLSFFDHLHDNTSGTASARLTNQTLTKTRSMIASLA